MCLYEGFSEEMTIELRYEGRVAVNYIKGKLFKEDSKACAKALRWEEGKERPYGREYKKQRST